MPKAALAFAGCKLNRYELQSISESLESSGFELVPFDDKADIYIINTCGVTGRAEVSSKQLIRRARRSGPDSKIVVTGCYSELNNEEVSGIGADLVIANSEKDSIATKVGRLMGSIPTGSDIAEFGARIISSMGGLTRGFVKIQEGCDRQCTYCTIWMSRGPVRSRRPEYIIAEINRLYENGYKEIVLTGVHIGMYSHGGTGLLRLLKMIVKETSMPRIRLSSLYPSEIEDGLIELMAGEKRICPYAHISAQSGDDEILKTMGRQYTRSEMIAVINRLTGSIPDITVGADIIVGFPGESENAFANTCDLVEQAGIHHLHVFSFSARPNTPAASMPNVVNTGDIHKRAAKLKKIGRARKHGHLAGFIGRKMEVLFEKRDIPGNRLTGLTGNYLRIEASGPSKYKGEIVPVMPREIVKETLLSDIIVGG